ncbi:CRE-TAG-253 protein [Caenorhabditis remanei]|uniref:CRE-TAG-253 protein n=2 Tax=Caenorhabditis remanei TaxID=31234 RepID=E3LK88_CAERE|nr:CRE-TAG-253 protein [Caenorhabditis remanei]
MNQRSGLIACPYIFFLRNASVIGGSKTTRGGPTRRRRPAQDQRGPPLQQHHPPRRDTSEANKSTCVTVFSFQAFILRVFQSSLALFLRTFGLLFARYLTFILPTEAINMSINGFGEHVRSASHAGSWYSGNQRDLDRQLTKWLDSAGERFGTARALISPHAGYSYCGETAAYAFKQIVPSAVERVFILGPSHVVALNGCAITTCSKYRTPLGDLIVDQKVTEDLRATRHFDLMDRRDEESEHSIEMQLPFIAKVMGPTRRYTIVPVLVGSLPGSRQQTYGNIFAHYMEDPKNLFVISSDFCHWGDRFSFSPFDRNSNLPIFEQITNMDKQGMAAIETLNPTVFNDYLKKTQNTICGRNPILIMLQAAEHFRLSNNHTHEFKFLHYTQSNKVRSPSDSSVSYASGVLFVHPK